MTYQQIMQDLKNKIYKPIYFLMGDETYFIDKITNYISDNVLPEAEKSFNQSVLYGKDTDIPTIINTARRFPMMANHQVVIVKEAQNIKKIEDLAIYVESPLNSTVLVINYKYKTIDKRKKLYKSLDSKGVVFESKKLYDDKIPAWIEVYLKSKGHKIQPAAAMMMAEFLGNDLGKISNELDKLTILVPQTEVISPEIIEKNIGISKEFNTFELQKALAHRNVLKANRIIQYFSQNPKDNPVIQVIGTLFGYFVKVMKYHQLTNKTERNVQAELGLYSSFFVREYVTAAKSFPPAKLEQIISILRESDARAKGVGSVSMDEGDILKEMVYKILH
jgi:DNA polymerase III subunit delta